MSTIINLIEPFEYKEQKGFYASCFSVNIQDATQYSIFFTDDTANIIFIINNKLYSYDLITFKNIISQSPNQFKIPIIDNTEITSFYILCTKYFNNVSTNDGIYLQFNSNDTKFTKIFEIDNNKPNVIISTSHIENILNTLDSIVFDINLSNHFTSLPLIINILNLHIEPKFYILLLENKTPTSINQIIEVIVHTTLIRNNLIINNKVHKMINNMNKNNKVKNNNIIVKKNRSNTPLTVEQVNRLNYSMAKTYMLMLQKKQ